MTGSLIQIYSTNFQDVFITSNPSVTFYRTLFKRYTNFATESIRQNFLSNINFGLTSTILVEKIGDLINNMFLEIKLPKINLVNKPVDKQNETNYKIVSNFIPILDSYIDSLFKIAKKVLQVIRIYNNYSYAEIMSMVTQMYLMENIESLANNIRTYLVTNKDVMYNLPILYQSDLYTDFGDSNSNSDKFFSLLQMINSFNLYELLLSANITNSHNSTSTSISSDTDKKNKILSLLNTSGSLFYKQARNYYSYFKKLYFHYKKKTSEKYKFAWVEEIGNAMIDEVSFIIGDQIIDSQTGDFMIYFNKIHTSVYHKANFDKMIGNVDKLTLFDQNDKDEYLLIIPLQFWFCRYYASSLPIVSLRYQDPIIRLSLKKIKKLCHVEQIERIDNPQQYSTYDSDNFFSSIKILDCSVHINYVFLGDYERKKFAENVNEYLIETVQRNIFKGLTDNIGDIELNLCHPMKYIGWYLQPDIWKNNALGTKCMWNKQTLESTNIKINGYVMYNLSSEYFNLIQPLLYFNNSFPPGLYAYSYCLYPFLIQPSGSINTSCVDSYAIQYKLSNNFDEYLKLHNSAFTFVSFAITMNILRFCGGFAKLAFQSKNY
jgi:hypothetical protein